jgi:hypothetical protein
MFRARPGRGSIQKISRRWVLIIWWIVCVPAHAQNLQFLPEIDAHLTLNSTFRAYLEAKEDRDGGDPRQAGIGPSIQLHRKPLVKLRKVKSFDLDDSKSRFLVIETGYGYIAEPNAPPENRIHVAVTSNFPLSAGFFISDRNRADLDWKNGNFTWRYRNKLTLDRTFAIRSYHLIPYIAAEPYYESQYNKWSTTALYAGCLFPVGKHVQFNSYYEHENNTGRRPNQQLHAIGIALNLYFSLQKK